MKKVMLIKPTDELRDAVAAVVPKFEQITSETVAVYEAKSSRDAGYLASSETIDMIFVDGALERPDLNALMGTLDMALLRRKLWMVLTPANHQYVPTRVLAQQLRLADKGFSPEFVYECLLLLSEKDRHLDVQVMKTIIRGIMKVINSHTSIPLVPGKVSSDQAQKRIATAASAVTTFYGEGIVGAVQLSGPRALLHSLAQRMFKEKCKDLPETIYQDFCCEIMNQTVGIVRAALTEHGYELLPGLNLALTGSEHRIMPRLAGKYLQCPFSFQSEQFVVTLYHAYRNAAVDEQSTPQGASTQWTLDVRLLNELRDIATSTIGKATRMVTQAGRWQRAKTAGAPVRSLHLANGTGRQGSFIIGLNIGDGLGASVGLRLAKERGGAAEDLRVRLFAKALELVVADFQTRALKYGYVFHEAFRTDFVGSGDFTYSLKSSGFFVQLPLKVGDFDMSLILGQDSRYASGVYNAWACI
jgi:CheY-specific phosphatase CheX